jgi:hypothetical protein
MTDHNNWWKKFFDDFRPVFREGTPRESNMEARYLVRKLQLKKGMKFLDCP